MTTVGDDSSGSAHRRVLGLPKYGDLGASSRLRFSQYLPYLAEAGLDVTSAPLLSDRLLAARYAHGGYGGSALLASYLSRCRRLASRGGYDLLWIEKEALPWWPSALESALLRGVPCAFDYDDAVFHAYDRHPRAIVRRLFGRRIDHLMRRAALVVAGNTYLAGRARQAGAPRVEILPTVIDLERYRPEASVGPVADGPARVVWIGSPSTARYLELLREPLAELARQRPFVLRVVGGGAVHLPGVPVEVLPWTEEGEVALLRGAVAGIMPLADSPWERGKCGYKLVQYMACGLAVVASPVGVNRELVREGDNGYLAADGADWIRALRALLDDADLRARLGAAGRRQVEQEYCVQRTGPRLAGWLREVSRASPTGDAGGRS
ncbi:MAG: glycosyltransferase family 4 protein [bacterium]|nr:glycosyltransferase family 4 protein [bacterium]